MPSDQPPPEPIKPEPLPPLPAEETPIEETPIEEPWIEAEVPAEPDAPAIASPRAKTKPTLPPGFVDETLPETGLRLLKQALRDAQPILKGVTIKVLRSTIDLLETTVDRLEAPPQPTALPSNPIAPESVVPESVVPESVAPLPAATRTGPIRDPAPSRSIASGATIGQKVQAVWRSTLIQVRSWLPNSLTQQLDDRALTGAIVGVVVVLIWATSAVLPEPAKAPEVAVAPPSVQAPVPSPVPPQVKAPAPPVPVSPAPKPSPSPALQLSPEQKLIASIQDQVAEVSDRYSSSLIRSVQANFRSSRLVVKLGESWYGLSETQQNKLSNELLKRAQQLDFVKLELSDPAGVLLARSPVVGSEMIILKRTSVPGAGAEETA